MIRLSLFISLLLTSVAVLADVQINIRGNVYIPPCTINNGQNMVARKSLYYDNYVAFSDDLLIIFCRSAKCQCMR